MPKKTTSPSQKKIIKTSASSETASPEKSGNSVKVTASPAPKIAPSKRATEKETTTPGENTVAKASSSTLQRGIGAQRRAAKRAPFSVASPPMKHSRANTRDGSPSFFQRRRAIKRPSTVPNQPAIPIHPAPATGLGIVPSPLNQSKKGRTTGSRIARPKRFASMAPPELPLRMYGKKKRRPTPLSDTFLEKQRDRLLQLKDMLLDSMNGVAHDNLHAEAGTSAFGMHQADAGSDAYDRDFALSILSQEQNSLYEIDEALHRIENKSYGLCEISGDAIPRARLEALPFTRYTVECQAELERHQYITGTRIPVSSLFGIIEEELEDEDEEGESSGENQEEVS